MKKLLAITLLSQFTTASSPECFSYSEFMLGDNDNISYKKSHIDELKSESFETDMKLNEIIGCVDSNIDKLIGITLEYDKGF